MHWNCGKTTWKSLKLEIARNVWHFGGWQETASIPIYSFQPLVNELSFVFDHFGCRSVCVITALIFSMGFLLLLFLSTSSSFLFLFLMLFLILISFPPNNIFISVCLFIRVVSWLFFAWIGWKQEKTLSDCYCECQVKICGKNARASNINENEINRVYKHWHYWVEVVHKILLLRGQGALASFYNGN